MIGWGRRTQEAVWTPPSPCPPLRHRFIRWVGSKRLRSRGGRGDENDRSRGPSRIQVSGRGGRGGHPIAVYEEQSVADCDAHVVARPAGFDGVHHHQPAPLLSPRARRITAAGRGWRQLRGLVRAGSKASARRDRYREKKRSGCHGGGGALGSRLNHLQTHRAGGSGEGSGPGESPGERAR
jgi:hypothetical protein